MASLSGEILHLVKELYEAAAEALRNLELLDHLNQSIAFQLVQEVVEAVDRVLDLYPLYKYPPVETK